MMNHYFNLPAPVLFVGAAGVGKTQKVVAQFDHTEILLLSGETEEGIAGLPYREGEYDRRTVPAFFERLHTADRKGLSTCLFLDEIDKADRSVADTLLTLVASRKINNNSLPVKTKIFAAANPPEYGGGDGLSTPMLNRFIVVDVNPCPQLWAAWAMERFKDNSTANKVIQMVLDEAFPILETVGDGIEQRTTSPRSLTMAIESLAFCVPEARETVLRGLLSPNAASKVLASLQKIEEKKYEDVFVNAEKVVSSVKRSAKNKRPIEL
jgi:MoxR-like ATPase